VSARHAACSCKQLRLTVEGEPIRVSICHCLACQRRTGSVFGVQARFDAEQVTTEGVSRQYIRVSDEGETFPAPTRSVWEERQHSWLRLPDDIEHMS
jgi:hypothetical protein